MLKLSIPTYPIIIIIIKKVEFWSKKLSDHGIAKTKTIVSTSPQKFNIPISLLLKTTS